MAVLAVSVAIGGCAEHVAPEGPYQCSSGDDCIDGWSCRATDTASLSICVEGVFRDVADVDGAELPETGTGDDGPEAAD